MNYIILRPTTDVNIYLTSLFPKVILLITIPTDYTWNLQARNTTTGTISTWDVFSNNNGSGLPTSLTGGGLGGGKYVRFTSAGTTYMYNRQTITCTNGFTFALLMRWTSTATSFERILQGTPFTNAFSDYVNIARTGGNPYITYNFTTSSGASYQTPVTTMNQNTWYVITFRYTNSDRRCQIQISTTGSGYTTTTLQNNVTGSAITNVGDVVYCLGGNNYGSLSTSAPPSSTQYGNFDLGALLFYNRSLTDNELYNVTNYLALGNSC